ncbi:hypothetical protein H8D30_01505 [bacterium]|nr:hypothetical protein [bacterium]
MESKSKKQIRLPRETWEGDATWIELPTLSQKWKLSFAPWWCLVQRQKESFRLRPISGGILEGRVHFRDGERALVVPISSRIQGTHWGWGRGLVASGATLGVVEGGISLLPITWDGPLGVVAFLLLLSGLVSVFVGYAVGLRGHWIRGCWGFLAGILCSWGLLQVGSSLVPNSKWAWLVVAGLAFALPATGWMKGVGGVFSWRALQEGFVAGVLGLGLRMGLVASGAIESWGILSFPLAVWVLLLAVRYPPLVQAPLERK